jgi:hypothetical protein
VPLFGTLALETGVALGTLSLGTGLAPGTLALDSTCLPADCFTRRWAGYATAKLPYEPSHSQRGPFFQYVQRAGERPDQYQYNAFLSTRDGDEVEALSAEYPKRWHVEEFFNTNQALGWDRAGTQNLHIRYGHMTMSLLAQALTFGLRQRLGPAMATGLAPRWRTSSCAVWKGIAAWTRAPLSSPTTTLPTPAS